MDIWSDALINNIYNLSNKSDQIILSNILNHNNKDVILSLDDIHDREKHRFSNNTDKYMSFACHSNNFEIIKYLVEKGFKNYNYGLHRASIIGNMNIINFFIDMGADDFNRGFEGACEGGHHDVINLMIKLGVTKIHRGLECACKKGNLTIVKMIIEKYPRKYDYAFWLACVYNYTEIVKILFDKITGVYINECFDEICCNGNLELFHLLKNQNVDYYSALYRACKAGNLEIVKLLFDIIEYNFSNSNIIKYNPCDIQKLNCCLQHACKGGYFYIINLILNKGANDYNVGLIGACQGIKLDVVKLMINRGAIDINYALDRMFCDGMVIFDKILNLPPNIYNEKHTKILSDVHNIIDLLIETRIPIHPSYLHKMSNKNIVNFIINHNKIVDANFNEIVNEKYLNNDMKKLFYEYDGEQLWKPFLERHSLFPFELQNRIFIFMISIKKFVEPRINQKIPKPLLWLIINMFIK